MTPVMWPGEAGVGGSPDKPGEGRNFLRAWSCRVPWKPLLSSLPALTVIEDSWGNCQGQNYRKLPCGQWGFSGYFPQWPRAVMASCLLAGCLCLLVLPSSQETLASVPSIFAQLPWTGFYPCLIQLLCSTRVIWEHWVHDRRTLWDTQKALFGSRP